MASAVESTAADLANSTVTGFVKALTLSSNLTLGGSEPALSYIVENAWAVCLVGMLVILFGALVTMALICCQCFCDRTGFCRENAGCCRCCSCCKPGDSDAPKASAKPIAANGKEPPAGQFMSA